QHRAHRQPRHAGTDVLASRVAFAESDVGEGRVGEHAVGHQPTTGGPIASSEVVPDDPEVVRGYVRELWAPGTFADRPDVGGTRLQALIHPYVAALIQLDAGPLEPDVGGVGRA